MQRRTVFFSMILLFWGIIACNAGPFVIERFSAQNTRFDEGRPVNRHLIILQSPTPTATFTPTVISTHTPATKTETGAGAEDPLPPSAGAGAGAPTPTPTSLQSATPTASSTATPTATSTSTPTPTATGTFTPTPSPTPTHTHTPDTGGGSGSSPTVAFSAGRYNVNEEDIAAISVVLSERVNRTVTVDYRTGDGSAIGGDAFCEGCDYISTNGTLTFPPGSRAQTFTITTIYDGIFEADETVNLSLQNAVNVSLGSPGRATLTILDNDLMVGFDSWSYSVDEDGGSATITVTLNGAASETVSVDYTTADNTAIAGSDYTAAGGTLQFNPGQTVRTFSVPITNDALNEFDEMIDLTLSNPVNAALSSFDTAELTILDDDTALTVNTGNDVDDGVCDLTHCSLREAINSANATAGTDTINFDIPGSGPYVIAPVTGLPALTDPLFIDGSTQPGITLDGGSMVQFGLSISTTATLNRLEIHHFNDSGIFNDGGNVVINDSIIRDNTATNGGGILNELAGVLTLNNTMVSGNSATNLGGGIYSEVQGVITINYSTIDNNSADSGGGIFNQQISSLIVNNSTINGNSAIAGDGGGICSIISGQVNINNSTVSGNSAQLASVDGFGGGIYGGGTVVANHITLNNNSAQGSGGGIFATTPFTMSNSIIANSTGGDCVGPAIDADYNLIEDGSCLGGFNSISGAANLGPLQANGGPTETHALLTGSPAINYIPYGSNGCGTLLIDQRGYTRPRPANGACDIGAYEVQ